MNIELILTVISIALQLLVVLYGWKMLRVALYLNTWKIGWGHFVVASFLILLRRLLWGFEYYVTGFEIPSTLEAMLTIFVSACMLWFASSMKIVFNSTNVHTEKTDENIPVLGPQKDLILTIDALDDKLIQLEIKIKEIRDKREAVTTKEKLLAEEEEIAKRIITATGENGKFRK
jgi:hypothetical protein